MKNIEFRIHRNSVSVLFIIATIVLAFAIDPCYGRQEISGEDEWDYQYGNKNLILRPPKGWNVFGEMTERKPVFSYNANTIIIYAEPTDAKDISEVNEDKIMQLMPIIQKKQHIEETYKERRIYIKDIPALEITFECELVWRIKYRQIFFVLDGLLCSCYFESPPAKYAETLPVFEAVVNSIRVEPVPPEPPKRMMVEIPWREEYISRDDIFSIRPPEGWKIEEEINEPDRIYLTFSKGEHTQIIIWTYEDDEYIQTTEKFKSEKRGGYHDALDIYRGQASWDWKDATIDGVDAIEFTFSLPKYNEEPPPKKGISINFVKNRINCLIRYTAPRSSYRRYLPVFRDCLSSFRVLKE